MASSIIHIAVANEVNKKLNRDKQKLFIGTISPDISKLIGEPKTRSHFLEGQESDAPNLEKFLNLYKENLHDDFVMGYYIHLYTDYLWFKYFLEDVDYSSQITTIEGNKIWCTKEDFIKYVYNDYTNINIKLIDEYNLDLKIFYNEIPEIKSIISEIPMDKLDIIVNKAGEIVINTKINKSYLFDIKGVKKFIETATELILSDIEKL